MLSRSSKGGSVKTLKILTDSQMPSGTEKEPFPGRIGQITIDKEVNQPFNGSF
jgi:hypothetical protein